MKIRLPARAHIFLLSMVSRTLWGLPSLEANGYWGYFLRSKRARGCIGLRFVAEVKSALSYTRHGPELNTIPSKRMDGIR